MASSNIDLTSLKPSTRSTRSTFATKSQSISISNAFNRLIKKQKSNLRVICDTCLHLILEYNKNYNLYIISREDLPN